MKYRWTRKPCKSCTGLKVEKEGTSHLLHLVLTLLTAGLWLPIWVLLVLNNWTKPWHCSSCGNKR